MAKASFEDQIESSRSIVEVFKLATSAEGLSAWLTATSKSDVHTSGKIHFDGDNDFGLAVFSSVELGKHAVINSENYGEIRIEFSGSESYSIVRFTFSKMTLPDERDDYLNFADQACSKFGQLVGDEN